MVWFRLWKLIHSETLILKLRVSLRAECIMYLGLTDRLRSRTRSRVHLLRLAQQLIAKLAWGATKTSRDALVRPSNLAVVDLAPWCTMWDKSRDFTKLANAVGL